MSYVLILASGGMDSTAMIHFYKSLDMEVELLFVDYGQLALLAEQQSVRAVAEYYNVKLIESRIQLPFRPAEGEMKGRNSIFLALALSVFNRTAGIVSIGIHSGTNYYDCSGDFAQKFEGLFNGYSNGCIKMGIPFLKFDKRMIYSYCIEHRIPLELTCSCEKGHKPGCGTCATCLDLAALT